MLQISTGQVQALKLVAREVFIDRMTDHAFDFQPQLCATLDRNIVRSTVDDWVTQADVIGFDQRGQAKLYIELGLLFGNGFVDDPQLPWVDQILSDPALEFPRQRAKALHQQVNAYLDAVHGPENEYVLRALQALVGTAGRKIWLESTDLDSALLEFLQSLHPQKLAYTGEEAIKNLIARAHEEASRYDMATPQGSTVLVVLMSAFGHRCTDDPLYPWIARTLTNEKITNGEQRAVRLEIRARTWLNGVIKNHPLTQQGG